MNAYDNDHVEVLDLRGSVAQDLHGAFMEWFAQARGTKCQKYLYSLSINPDRRQGGLSPEQYLDFVSRVEKRLGLTSQPRAIVLHVKRDKEGVQRPHWHAVWSRIDTDKMRAVQIAHDRMTLRRVTQEFARDHGITLPRSMRDEKSFVGTFNEQARSAVKWTEKQQQERSGISREQHAEAITDCWRRTTDARSFVAELEKHDYFLARGETRQTAYVVIDILGEVHSLARRIDGVRTKGIRERLGQTYPLERLPGVTEARQHAKRTREARQAALETKTPESQAQTKEQAKEQAKQALLKLHEERRAELNALKQTLLDRHAAERKALKELQSTADKAIAAQRQKAQPKGIVAFLTRITGIRMMIDARHRKQDERRAQLQAAQREALGRRHGRESQELERRDHALALVEQREKRSLRARPLREKFHGVALPPKAVPQAPALTEEQRAKLAAFRQSAAAFKTKSSQDTSGWTSEKLKHAAETARQQQAKSSEAEGWQATSTRQPHRRLNANLNQHPAGWPCWRMPPTLRSPPAA
jgi:hypothetical protein